MKIAVFGLSISSSWGNGHATLWRGLCRGLHQLGHTVLFFEKDVPWYAGARDSVEFPGCELRLYASWDEVRQEASAALRDADAAVVTSYCPDALAACDLVLRSAVPAKVFYDLDTPVTFSRLDAKQSVEYVPAQGLAGFDLVLSYTGGVALDRLRRDLGARRVLPLYGSVDPAVHRPVLPVDDFRGELSYLGTWAADRQETLEELFIVPARHLPDRRFVIAGAQYPDSFPWTRNMYFMRHLEPALHPAFFCSSRATLNVTRRAMADMGYCPSGRLFEASSCGVPVISDVWEGIDQFYKPGDEIVLCRTSQDMLNALSMSDAEFRRIGNNARERTLAEHTAERRALEFESALEEAACSMQA
ncbi:MAG TPA: glycosyltransferase [Bryobacteraceae bacterium]|nr:glycosyltransferase [Bryobacteraceae bacterium]